mmetsp:Transcript_118419/g.339974  ORF Transcript_118419/g.339974 Transcript_118419/m.339974 type:complete len:259 (-) Transcript_118419:167-943(-)
MVHRGNANEHPKQLRGQAVFPDALGSELPPQAQAARVDLAAVLLPSRPRLGCSFTVAQEVASLPARRWCTGAEQGVLGPELHRNDGRTVADGDAVDAGAARRARAQRQLARARACGQRACKASGLLVTKAQVAMPKHELRGAQLKQCLVLSTGKVGGACHPATPEAVVECPEEVLKALPAGGVIPQNLAVRPSQAQDQGLGFPALAGGRNAIPAPHLGAHEVESRLAKDELVGEGAPFLVLQLPVRDPDSGHTAGGRV